MSTPKLTALRLECLMTAKEAAAYLRFSARLLRERCRAADIPHLRIFGHLRFRRTALDLWIADQQRDATRIQQEEK